MRLTEAELVMFREEGFVVKYGVLDPALMAEARDLLWASAPPSVRRDEPASWVGPIRPEDEGIVLMRDGVATRIPAGMIHGTATVNQSGFSWRCRTAGAERCMLDMTATALWEVAEQLLGEGEVVPPTGESVGEMLAHRGEDATDADALARIAAESDVGFPQLCARYAHSVIAASDPARVAGGQGASNSHAALPEGMDHRDVANLFVAGTRARGIYGILPQPPGTERRLPGPEGCHTDAHPFHLGVMAYIDDVPPNGGGLRLWPGSHKRVFHTFERQHTSFRGEAFAEAMKEVAADTPAVDTYGPAGTVVFWHHRLGHNPGTNWAGQNIRQAVLFDFIKENVDDGPPPADMWRDWSEELRQAGGSGRTAKSSSAKL
jgi:hypothetical protein